MSRGISKNGPQGFSWVSKETRYNSLIRLALPWLAALTLGGCAELYEHYSTWPDLPPPQPVTAPDDGTDVCKGDDQAVAEDTVVQTKSAEIEPGTGTFVQPPRSHHFDSENGDITLNFADADIREVVRTILGDILGRNYVIDPSA